MGATGAGGASGASSIQRNFPVIPEVSRSVQNEFRTLRQMLYDTQADLETTRGKIQNLNSIATGSQPSPTTGSTGSALSTMAAGAVTNTTGTNPNVTQLLGILAQAQRSYIPYYTSLPLLQDPASQNGSLVSVNGVLYRFDGSSQPGQWKVQGAVAVALIDTHANRLASYPPSAYPSGTLFYETDTELLYIDNAGVWINISGPVLLEGTHTNRLASTPSVNYAFATAYYETDRTVRYWIQNSTGTVTVTGGVNVAWVSGNHFINTGSGFNAAQWPAGTAITINGVVCHVAAVASPTALTLQVATTNAAGVSYAVANGRWVYLDDQNEAAYASKPTDLGENDVAINGGGFLFYDNATYIRRWEWKGAAWIYAAGELPGGDTSPAIMMLAGNSTPPGWAPCATGSVTITKADATTVSFTVPAFNSGVGYYAKGGSYTGTPVAVVDPLISPVTPAGSVTLTGSTPAMAGVGASIPTGATFAGTPVTPVVGTSGEPEHISIGFYVKL